MGPMGEIGKLFLVLGILLLLMGCAFLFLPKIPFMGKLPGDIVVKRENFFFYFPVVTCLLLSLVLSLIFSILAKR